MMDAHSVTNALEEIALADIVRAFDSIEERDAAVSRVWDEFASYLRRLHWMKTVNGEQATEAFALARELAGSEADPSKIDSIYEKLANFAFNAVVNSDSFY